MRIFAWFVVLSVLFWAPSPCRAEKISPGLEKIRQSDTLCNVWVVFTDKPSGARRADFPKRTVGRRIRAGFGKKAAEGDIPVSWRYLKEIEREGGALRSVFPWANAASFTLHASAIGAVAKKSCVKKVLPVRSFRRKDRSAAASRLSKSAAPPDTAAYGGSIIQMRMIGVPDAHEYLIRSLRVTPGDGVVIGLFDSGFRLGHRCFDFLTSHQSIVADSNFVDCNGELSDADSVRRAFLNDPWNRPPEEHGSQTLALLAGYDPGKFLGVAWGARFILAKTEWAGRVDGGGSVVDVEVHGEEDNWVAALVWAESLGVDIVSSSLAYRTDFTDSLGNDRDSDDYAFEDMDGKTTIISRAASEAAKRGVIIVNAVGNEEGAGPATVNAPADAPDVVAVGGVDWDGKISSFSCRGPTANGRIKPDVVALAEYLYFPDIYSSDSASYRFGGDGTSYAAPMIAGICGLILQTHPADDASRIRELLYASCRFAPRQDSIDNRYGRGIPVALRACRGDSARCVSPEPGATTPAASLTVIGDNHRVSLAFKPPATGSPHASYQCVAEVRSLQGKSLWKQTGFATGNREFTFTWPPARQSCAAGTYCFVVHYGGMAFMRRFAIPATFSQSRRRD